MKISVIICTLNPKSVYLEKVLFSLREQTLKKTEWELLLVDNGSQEILESKWDLSWHPNSRHIREEELGLTPARIRGIKEAKSDLLIFVDDDNLLAPDYLEHACSIADSYSFLGAWGGNIEPVFECEPQAWVHPFLPRLGFTRVVQDRWSNLKSTLETTPCGVGLCIRRLVAIEWVRRVREENLRKLLGRCGASLVSGEDTDLAWTACDMGMGTGLFSRLRAEHMLPGSRLEWSYIERLIEGMAYTWVLLRPLHGLPIPAHKIPRWRRVAGQLKRMITMNRIERLAWEARIRGEQRALEQLHSSGQYF